MIAIRLTILFFIISLVSSCSQEDASIDSSVFDKEISSSYERPKPNPEKNVYSESMAPGDILAPYVLAQK